VKPGVEKVLEVLAGSLMMEIAPHVSQAYRQSSVGVSAILLTMIREEWDRAASRRIEENAALRALFRDAAPAVTDTDLRRRLETAAAERDPDARVSTLDSANDALRALLIDLHAHVEELDSAEAKRIDEAIWKELALSTERRRFALAPF
jgi:FKBP-type peptidyl-prolyl cis-trans isomerase (trigger factor)